MNEDQNIKNFEGSVRRFFASIVKVIILKPNLIIPALITFYYQIKLAKRRNFLRKSGIVIPPILIISVTKTCNLNCKGCYAKQLHANKSEDMSAQQFKSLIGQAKDAGISIIVFVGGEPLMRKQEIFDIAKHERGLSFFVFTNATLIDDEAIKIISKTKNIIPIISMEGPQIKTDNRRGIGVSEQIRKILEIFAKKNVIWGTSLTLMKSNIKEVFDESFTASLYKLGCKIFFYSEYVPTEANTNDLVPTLDDKKIIKNLITELEKKYNSIFLSFPGDESNFGGCLSSGRGFVHIASDGSLEPCPMAPYSDINVTKVPLLDALSNSEYLKKIRSNMHLLDEKNGTCALWENKELVNKLLK